MRAKQKINTDNDREILYARMSGLISRICGVFRLSGAGAGCSEEERIDSIRNWLDAICKSRKEDESVCGSGQVVPERHQTEVEEQGSSCLPAFSSGQLEDQHDGFDESSD